jgi:hypothetical protein
LAEPGFAGRLILGIASAALGPSLERPGIELPLRGRGPRPAVGQFVWRLGEERRFGLLEIVLEPLVMELLFYLREIVI